MSKSTSQSSRPVVALCASRYAPADPSYRALAPLALACQSEGMSVVAYALDWQGDVPQGVELVRKRPFVLKQAARENRYWRQLPKALKKAAVDIAVGFEAQPCFDLHLRSSADGQQQLVLADHQVLEELPPMPEKQPARIRTSAQGDKVVLAMAGGDLVKHGFERLVVGVGRMAENLRSRCRIVACGQLEPKFLASAQVMSLGDAVEVDAAADPRKALREADLFVDLSFKATANPWIYDALASGVGVFTHGEIQEAELVRRARAGVVLDAPFRQEDCNRVLADAVALQRQRQAWRRNAAQLATRRRKWFGQAELIAKHIKRMAT